MAILCSLKVDTEEIVTQCVPDSIWDIQVATKVQCKSVHITLSSMISFSNKIYLRQQLLDQKEEGILMFIRDVGFVETVYSITAIPRIFETSIKSQSVYNCQEVYM